MILEDKLSQAEAKEYVLKKAIIRPKTTVLSLVLFVLRRMALGIVSGVVFYFLVDFSGVCKKNCVFPIVLVSILVVLLLSLKKIAILCVECYQHYAPEEYRRMCLCKPTCSEYAIIVLRQYNLMKALSLVWIRLKKTCRETYKIDNP